MTDKQIIIDGVDVSGCPFFEDERKLLNPAGQELNFKNICSLSFYNFTDFDKDFLCNQSPNCYYKQLKRKEQECEELKVCLFQVQNASISLTKQLDQLKAEVKSKTEYIQEQREIIDQYSKEIEMYKKCQGKRASKREEELKAENEELKDERKNLKWDLENNIQVKKHAMEQLDQLKRKEQECEMLKLSEKSLTETIENIARGFEELKAENEQLKNFHINLVGVKECEIKELAELKADNKHLNDLLNQALKELEEMRELKDTESLQACILTRENERLKELLAQDQCFQGKSHKCVKSFYIDERYKQAIKKIKEIIHFNKNNRLSGGACISIEQILQICDEVTE